MMVFFRKNIHLSALIKENNSFLWIKEWIFFCTKSEFNSGMIKLVFPFRICDISESILMVFCFFFFNAKYKGLFVKQTLCFCF